MSHPLHTKSPSLGLNFDTRLANYLQLQGFVAKHSWSLANEEKTLELAKEREQTILYKNSCIRISPLPLLKLFASIDKHSKTQMQRINKSQPHPHASYMIWSLFLVSKFELLGSKNYKYEVWLSLLL